ncbi:uncharacterized protein LOC143250013 [Tachypleus tridentatus]|uniref:uncharacterized protein LOC143250013 n=1 Tax=Tachypleus tridentatus TaxID=6853 RepID=UPI003FD27B25
MFPVLFGFHMPIFPYPNINSSNGTSGVISPSGIAMFTSSVTASRSSPRTTPISRWNPPFITLDDNMDYTVMGGLVTGQTSEEEAPQLIGTEERFFSAVHCDGPIDTSINHANTPTKSQPS